MIPLFSLHKKGESANPLQDLVLPAAAGGLVSPVPSPQVQAGWGRAGLPGRTKAVA